MKFFLGFITGIGTAIIGLLVWGWLMIGKVTDIERRSPALTAPGKSSSVVFNFGLKDLRSDSSIDLSIFKNKVVLVNFWEHWCAPCRIEMPSLDKLYKQVNDSDIVFAIISRQNAETVRKDIALKDFSLPFFHLTGTLPPELNNETVPRTYIINKAGDLVVKETGMANWYERRVIHFIDSLKAL
jgi:thiol-disulfide isomerase/thioredoxin